MTTEILYRAGYKYQLAADYTVQLDIIPLMTIETEFISLDQFGVLTLRRGYAWDGPSGPTIDTANFMRGSLVHDALYQLIRLRFLHPNWRLAADETLRRHCRQDGMSRLRAWWVYRAVRLGGGPAADPASVKKVWRAPKLGTLDEAAGWPS